MRIGLDDLSKASEHELGAALDPVPLGELIELVVKGAFDHLQQQPLSPSARSMNCPSGRARRAPLRPLVLYPMLWGLQPLDE